MSPQWTPCGARSREETGWRLREVLAELDPITYTGDDGLTRTEEDFIVRVDGDLAAPRLEAGKHTEYRWIGASDVADLFDAANPTPADDLMRAIITAGFDQGSRDRPGCITQTGSHALPA